IERVRYLSGKAGPDTGQPHREISVAHALQSGKEFVEVGRIELVPIASVAVSCECGCLLLRPGFRRRRFRLGAAIHSNLRTELWRKRGTWATADGAANT